MVGTVNIRSACGERIWATQNIIFRKPRFRAVVTGKCGRLPGPMGLPYWPILTKPQFKVGGLFQRDAPPTDRTLLEYGQLHGPQSLSSCWRPSRKRRCEHLLCGRV